MPIDDRPLTQLLFSLGKMRAQRSPRFDREPPAGPVSRDRMAGLMLGLAIGDALGNSCESMSPSERHATRGEVRDYAAREDEGAVGLPSDDTQMAAWTLECLLADDALLAGMITHNDALSNSVCVAFTHLLWELLHAERPPQASW